MNANGRESEVVATSVSEWIICAFPYGYPLAYARSYEIPAVLIRVNSRPFAVKQIPK